MEGLFALGGLVIGFIAGTLVYRNNAKKFERIANDAIKQVKSLKDEIKNLKH